MPNRSFYPTRRETLAAAGAALTSMGVLRIGRAQATSMSSNEGMLKRKIASTGEVIPVIGMGTWQTFDVGDSAEARADMKAVLGAFHAAGGTVIDSSPMYGRSEEVVGDLAADLGIVDQLFLATKVWMRGKDEGVRQMNDSMRKLRSEVIDLMEVHNLLDVEPHLDTLRGWKEEGKIRYIGVTHYTAGAHDDVAAVIKKHPVDFIQINYSVGERNAEKRLLPLARDRGIAVIANRPFGGGALIRNRIGQPLPDWAAEIDAGSWAQILLKFVISHPAITCAIPATSKVKHLQDNMQAGHGRLPDESLRKRIAAEFAKANR